MEDTAAFLRRAAGRCGFVRDRYVDRDVPTNPDSVAAVHFFGDLRSEFVLSSLLLKRFRDEVRGSKYMVLCSWKGHGAWFPYADEYWSPSGGQDALHAGALGMGNGSEVYDLQRRDLNYFFSHVVTPEDVREYYDGGLTTRFHERLRVVKRFLPMVPSATYLGAYFNQELVNRPGIKVLLMPSKHGRGVVRGRLANVKSCRAFWAALLERLVASGYCPVVVQNHSTHDLSGGLSDRCVFVREEDVGKIMGMMRATGCVLDVFGGVSRLAVAARAPFVAVDERGRYGLEREYEVDDLCAPGLPKQYIFSFPTIIEGGDARSWDGSLFDSIVTRLNSFLPGVDRNALPGTSEGVAEVPFSAVRERRSKRVGARFVKVPRD